MSSSAAMLERPASSEIHWIELEPRPERRARLVLVRGSGRQHHGELPSGSLLAMTTDTNPAPPVDDDF